MNMILQNLLQQAARKQLQNNPLMPSFNQMMNGKNFQQQMQTIINLAQSKGIDVNAKVFSQEDLRALGLISPQG